MGEKARYDEFMATLATAKEIARSGDCADVDAAERLVGAMGQSFTTMMFAFAQVNSLKSDVDFLTSLVQQHDEPWVGTVAAALLRRPVKTLRTRYRLEQTADLQEKPPSWFTG